MQARRLGHFKCRIYRANLTERLGDRPREEFMAKRIGSKRRHGPIPVRGMRGYRNAHHLHHPGKVETGGQAA